MAANVLSGAARSPSAQQEQPSGSLGCRGAREKKRGAGDGEGAVRTLPQPVGFPAQTACGASHPGQAGLSSPSPAVKFNSCVTLKLFPPTYRRHRGGRWLLLLPLPRTEATATVGRPRRAPPVG